MTFKRPCLDCGALSLKSRCESCTTRLQQTRGATPQGQARQQRKKLLYGNDYSKRAKAVRANAIICHICGEGAKQGTGWGWEADHLYPELGSNSPLAPAHRRCNQARGNKPLTN